MNELISTFHIDWKLMIAQIINFGLVFLALYFIAAKPLSKLIKDRTEEITTGFENAKKAEGDIANANIKKEEIIREARDDAKKVLASSQADGKEIVKEAKTKAELEKEEIIKQAKLDAEKAELEKGVLDNADSGKPADAGIKKSDDKDEDDEEKKDKEGSINYLWIL